MPLNLEQKQKLNSTGFFVPEPTGGPQKKKYYLPDGREILAIPSMREYVIKDKDGRVTSSGVRDANLDNGWRESPFPESERQLHCPNCDMWHKTQADITRCGAAKKAKQKKLEEYAMKKFGNGAQTTEVAALTKRMDKLDERLDKVLALLEKVVK